MPQCVTCGSELHPERAQKYNYCMSRECQEKNAKGLTMVAIGVNKAAEQYMILDDRIREELASGKYHDQRRGTFGLPAAAPAGPPAAPPADRPARPSRTGRASGAEASGESGPERKAVRPAPARKAAPPARRVSRRPWSRSQEKLALLYNEQGLQPAAIAQKLGLSTYSVTQIILASRNRGKL